jgi:phospholipid/cholesterol/gamma-HCH transport system substrate-binding protein
MKSNKGIDFAVGLFVLAAILSFAWMAINVTIVESSGSNKSIKVTASFDNIGSLKAKSPVMVAGVRVGRVMSIQLDPDTLRANIDISLDSSISLPDDSDASIRTAGLVGEQYLSLNPGGSERNFQEGDRIKITQSALVIEELVGKFMTSMSNNGSANAVQPEAIAAPQK